MSENQSNIKSITSEKTFSEIYDIAKKDRERAIEAYDDMRATIEALPKEKINSMYYQALNQAQQLIQTSTDKLIGLAKVLNSKENVKQLNQINFDLTDASILEDKVEDFADKTKKLGVNSTPKIGGNNKF